MNKPLVSCEWLSSYMMAGNHNLLTVVKWGHLLGGCRVSMESKARKHSSNLVRDWESKVGRWA